VKEIVIAAFYKFVPLVDFDLRRKPLLAKMQTLDIKGTIILAAEGINGSFAGTRVNMDAFYQFLRSDSRLVDLNFKETFDDENPFDKIKVKLRNEIVTLGVAKVNPLKSQGEYVSPEQWNALLQDPELVLIDTRNEYEYRLGTFKNAINPSTENFRDFPDFVEKELLDKKNKKIAMFCTGGIRCEKSTAYLKDQGFEQVYHLQDGILHYLETVPEKESRWEGACFVFDNRVAVDNQLNRVYPQLPLDYKHEKPPRDA